MSAFTVTTSQGEIAVSPARVVRVADRMWSWEPARRRAAILSASERLKGKHPSKHDAAITLVGRGYVEAMVKAA